MPNFGSLEVKGHNGRKVQNTFIKQESAAKGVAILFPGLYNTCDAPLTYYASSVLVNLGFDVLWVDYECWRSEEFMHSSEEGRRQWIAEEARAAFDAAMKRESYKNLVIVGKSIGTYALTALIDSGLVKNNSKIVWYTPLLYGNVLDSMKNSKNAKSLFIMGTGDEAYDAAAMDKAKKITNGETLVITGANHSMEIEGSAKKSVTAMAKIVSALEAFFAQ